MKPKYFKSQAAFRAWLDTHHASERELWVGFYKKASGKGGLAYLEAVDEGLCYGWIDGIKKRVDDLSFMHRFTPRTKTSSWSLVNTKRFAYLKRRGRVAPPGLKAFEARDRKRSGVYLYEQRWTLAPEYEKQFRSVPGAWEFFEAQPPGYKRLLVGWIMQGKKEETRLKRLEAAIDGSKRHTRVRWM